MVDDSMVCVDRIIASAACFQEPPSLPAGAAAAVDGVERESEARGSVGVGVGVGGENGGGVIGGDEGFGGEGCSFGAVKGKGSFLEEDEEKDMEAPCACNGTLKVGITN